MTSTLPPIVQAFSGSIGSASANALTYPLDLITTRIQLESPKRSKTFGGIYGALLMMRHIVRKYGWEAFYDGVWPDTCATLLSNFFYFYFYSFLRNLSTRNKLTLQKTVKELKPHKPSLLEELALGFVAGLLSRAITTPLNIITLRLQTERDDESDDELEIESPRGRLRIGDIVRTIYTEQGLKGFWRGFQTTAVLSLNPSITLMCFQAFRRILGIVKSPGSLRTGKLSSKVSSASINTNPRPWEAFMGAAISNSIAVLLLYPLILVKTRLQATDASSAEEVVTDAYYGRDHNLIGDKIRFAEEGPKEEKGNILRLYQGLQVQILKGFLRQGVTFLVKGRVEQLIVAVYLRQMKARHQ